MAWMNIQIYVAKDLPLVPNIVNLDTIIRVGPNETGSYLKFVDGSTVDVVDPFQEIAEVVLKAQEKQNGIRHNE